jgi:hypothetical protein
METGPTLPWTQAQAVAWWRDAPLGIEEEPWSVKPAEARRARAWEAAPTGGALPPRQDRLGLAESSTLTSISPPI